jgi:hypothetical protein
MFRLFVLVVLLLVANVGRAQFPKLPSVPSIPTPTLPNIGGTKPNTGPLSADEVVRGLKEALRTGTGIAVKQLNAENGYFGDKLLKILLPAELKRVQGTLQSLPGGNDLMNKLILQMNRAAEKAAIEAQPILTDAITGMTIQDGFQILRGDSVAATTYLRKTTSQAISAKFRPRIQAALEKVGAQQTYTQVMTLYNNVPFVQRVNPDLAGYVTDRALNGLFTKVGREEVRIRKQPAARITELLKRVFGS